MDQSSKGTEIPIEAILEKGSLAGFAKFQLELPDAFQAKQLDSKGGSFTYVDQKMKIVWMNLPSESEVRIKFILTPASSFSGKLNLSASFSYVAENETQKYFAPDLVIQIGGAPAPNLKEAIQPEPKEDTSDKELIPVETQKSIETIETKKEIVQTQTPSNAATETIKPKTKTPEVQETKVVSVISSGGKSKGLSSEISKSSASEAKKIIPSESKISDQKINFRVQIKASKTREDAVQIQASIGGQKVEALLVEGGMFKFLSGNFQQYIQARDLRDEIRNKGYPDAFIVAFDQEKIIPIDQALKQTNQKWVR